MVLDLVFLGTGGSAPTARRSTACLLARAGGDRLLFDCGEGSQRQMQRSTGLVPVNDIFVTHLHADHFLGLPGLLKTYALNDRERPLQIFGPPGLIELFKSLRLLFGRLPYEVDLVELEPGEPIAYEGYSVEAYPVEHRTRAFGYALIEDDRPGHLDPEAAARLGITSGPDLGRLQRGEEVQGRDGLVRPDQVVGERRRGRRIVITGDTAPCDATLVAADGAQLLVHDASFADAELERALATGHSTARQAAQVALEAGVELLALVHVSSRYDIREVLAEAREVLPGAIAPRDFDVVEIPFPERGAPVHVEGGARPPRSSPPDAEAAGPG